jgi:predicted ATP-grasp superfamily ATP-dependent carboligase
VVVGGSVAGLGAARSLSMANASVVVLDTSRFNAALWSRHCKGRVIAGMSGDRLIGELKAASSCFPQRPLLMLTQDAAVEAVSLWRKELEPYYCFLLPPAEVVELLNDKGQFHDFAVREGFPVPRGAVVRCSDDLLQIESLRAPLIVKPACKTDLQDSGLARAARFDRIDDAKAHCMALLKFDAQAIVQEWIDGPDHDIYFCLFFCDPSGRPLRFFTGRKLSAYPPEVGSTATCIAAPEAHDELEALTIRLTTGTRYAGMGGLEFKRNARTGEFIIIEPTVGRTDWQEEIATLSGANIPMAAWLYETGQPIPRIDKTPVRVAWRTSLKHRAPASLRKANVRIADGYWRASDPIPGLIFYGIEPVRRMIHHCLPIALMSATRWLFNKAKKFAARWVTAPARM